MDKMTFLKDLENALEGEVSRTVINDTLNYYNQYIVDEVNKGKSEEEVIRSLGSGNVIAKTVIASQEARTKDGPAGYNQSHSGYASDSGQDMQRDGGPEQKGFHMSMDRDGNMRFQYGRFQFNSWYGKLIGILIAVLVIVLLIMLIAGLFSLLWALLPIFLVLFLFITLFNFLSGR